MPKIAEGFGPIYRNGKQNEKYYNPSYTATDTNNVKPMKNPKKTDIKSPFKDKRIWVKPGDKTYFA